MKVSGIRIRLMEEELFIIVEAISILESLKKIRLMDLEFIFIRMAVGMKETGFMMSKKVKERKYGLMVQNILEIIKQE